MRMLWKSDKGDEIITVLIKKQWSSMGRSSEKFGIGLKANGLSCGSQVQDFAIYSLVDQDWKIHACSVL